MTEQGPRQPARVWVHAGFDESVVFGSSHPILPNHKYTITTPLDVDCSEAGISNHGRTTARDAPDAPLSSGGGEG